MEECNSKSKKISDVKVAESKLKSIKQNEQQQQSERLLGLMSDSDIVDISANNEVRKISSITPNFVTSAKTYSIFEKSRIHI